MPSNTRTNIRTISASFYHTSNQPHSKPKPLPITKMSNPADYLSTLQTQPTVSCHGNQVSSGSTCPSCNQVAGGSSQPSAPVQTQGSNNSDSSGSNNEKNN